MSSSLMPCRLVPCVLLIGLSSCASAPAPPPSPAVEQSAAETPVRAASEVTASTGAKPEIETLVFQVEIAAPVERVWDTMLGPEGYRQWTKPFQPGSYYEGSWSEGGRMHFLAPGGSGMVAEIAAHRPHELVRIEHLGYVVNGVEDTTSEAVRSWAPAYETYRFASVPGGTLLTVEQDVLVGFEAYMNRTWPEALAALESLCEAD